MYFNDDSEYMIMHNMCSYLRNVTFYMKFNISQIFDITVS